MKFTKKEVELIKYSIEYLLGGELLEENGWTDETIGILENLYDREFDIEE